MKPAIELENLNFGYLQGAPVFNGISLSVPMHSCALLLGANGSGKSTLLRIIAGKHLIPDSKIRVMGEDPFLTPASDKVHYIGGYFPLELDLSVEELLVRYQDVPVRYRDELLDLLCISPSWRMHRVSSGQRRRVDLLLSLLRPPKLFLLDEVTSELDILMRQDLLAWLKKQCLERKITVVFATHILDGLESWADQLLFLSPVPSSNSSFRVRHSGDVPKPLFEKVNQWLVEDRQIRKIYI